MPGDTKTSVPTVCHEKDARCYMFPTEHDLPALVVCTPSQDACLPPWVQMDDNELFLGHSTCSLKKQARLGWLKLKQTDTHEHSSGLGGPLYSDTPLCNHKTFVLHKPFSRLHLLCVCVYTTHKVHVWSSEDNFSTMLVLGIKFRSLEWQVSLPTERFCKLSDKSPKTLTLV